MMMKRGTWGWCGLVWCSVWYGVGRGRGGEAEGVLWLGYIDKFRNVRVTP